MTMLRTAASLVFVFLISCGVSRPYQSERPSFAPRDASFFIVSETQMSSWEKAKTQCPLICREEGGQWTGAWSQQSPLILDAGTCECRDLQAQASPVIPEAPKAPMSMEEMQAAFDVPEKPEPVLEGKSMESAAKPAANPASGGATRSAGTNRPSSTATANSEGDVSATVTRDPQTGTVTATAQAGRARAQSRSVPSGEATATITRDPKTGAVTATASAGGATSTATSRRDPFDI